MEYRQFGKSGLKVPVLSYGIATFGGRNEFFERWGKVDVEDTPRAVSLELPSGRLI